MTTPELTRDELLKRLPKMNLKDKPRDKEGREISAEEGARKIEAYDEFVNAVSSTMLNGQTYTIGFKVGKLMAWLEENRAYMDWLQVYFSVDEDDRKLSVVFWPYNSDGLPAAEIDGKGDLTLRAAYNIGNKT